MEVPHLFLGNGKARRTRWYRHFHHSADYIFHNVEHAAQVVLFGRDALSRVKCRRGEGTGWTDARMAALVRLRAGTTRTIELSFVSFILCYCLMVYGDERPFLCMIFCCS